MFIVTGTRKEMAPDGRHQHIRAVCLQDGSSYTRSQVVVSLRSGEKWYTRGADGSRAEIKISAYCPAPSCYESPYITTAPDHTTTNNLDNLPPC